MKKTMWTFAFIGVCLAAASGTTRAQQPAGPRVEIAIRDTLAPAPGEVRPAVRDSSGNLMTRPGDVIRYTLTATNRGRDPAYNVEIVDPIPEGTEYVIGSAAGEGMALSYSIDGGRFYQEPPVTYEVRRPDGAVEKRPAPAGMYTHVKWRVTRPIPPGGRASATLRVRVMASEMEPEGG